MATCDAAAAAILGLLGIPGIGPVRANRILARLNGNDRSRGESPYGEGMFASILDEGLRPAWAQARQKAIQSSERLCSLGADVLTIVDPRYPQRLKDLLGYAAPPVLTILGNADLLTLPGVGFCGSRRASDKGMSTATDCANQLARHGVNVVSGYAAGVDSTVHKAALLAGGTTTGVLAEGLLHFRAKRDMLSLWDPDRTLVVSELAPEATWSVANAMQRNKTICALSLATVLIEAGLRGGSMAAGRTCLEMGLPLFAAVYEGMPSAAAGNEELLRAGARRLLRNRATPRANVGPVLAAIRERASGSMQRPGRGSATRRHSILAAITSRRGPGAGGADCRSRRSLPPADGDLLVSGVLCGSEVVSARRTGRSARSAWLDRGPSPFGHAVRDADTRSGVPSALRCPRRS